MLEQSVGLWCVSLTARLCLSVCLSVYMSVLQCLPLPLYLTSARLGCRIAKNDE